MKKYILCASMIVMCCILQASSKESSRPSSASSQGGRVIAKFSHIDNPDEQSGVFRKGRNDSSPGQLECENLVGSEQPPIGASV